MHEANPVLRVRGGAAQAVNIILDDGAKRPYGSNSYLG
jgi:hypothetical protein